MSDVVYKALLKRSVTIRDILAYGRGRRTASRGIFPDYNDVLGFEGWLCSDDHRVLCINPLPLFLLMGAVCQFSIFFKC